MPWRRQPAHSAELLAHWQALGQALGRDTPAWRAEGRRLLRSWARWPRAYHDTTHLRACLRHLQAVLDQQPGALQDPHAVALALWYHDAIYWPWSGHNEERSADWARQFLLSQGLPTALVDAVHQHVMDTRHTPAPHPRQSQQPPLSTCACRTRSAPIRRPSKAPSWHASP